MKRKRFTAEQIIGVLKSIRMASASWVNSSIT